MDWETLKPATRLKCRMSFRSRWRNSKEGFVPPNPAFAYRTHHHRHGRAHLLEIREKNTLDLRISRSRPARQNCRRRRACGKFSASRRLPWFRHDEGVLNLGVRTDDYFNLPPGPNNPVGILWMGLNKPGIGIHGTNNPETIGRAGSHGCIRTRELGRGEDQGSGYGRQYRGHLLTLFAAHVEAIAQCPRSILERRSRTAPTKFRKIFRADSSARASRL